MALDIEISKDNYKILRVDSCGKKIYIGSKYNQKREIKKFVDSVWPITYNDIFIILGLSLGEHIEEIQKYTELNQKILIVEFNKELIQYCRSDKKIAEILNKSGIKITNSIKEVDDFFQNYVNKSNVNFVKVNTYCKYANIFWNEYEHIYSHIKSSIFNIVINRNTLNILGNKYFENFLGNIKYIAKNPEINILKDKYKNKPAVIVSAGPSLSKNVNLLRNIDNTLILTGGRTIKTLMERNIHPSLLGIVDPTDKSYEIVKDVIEKVDYPLYFNDVTPTYVLLHHKRKKIYSLQNQFLNDILKKDIPSLYGGGSIAHSLTEVALYIGCNPIIYIGQDLAYTNDLEHDNSARNPGSDAKHRIYKRNDDIYVDDIYGNKVRTSLVLNSYRENLEKIISENPSISFINATEGGSNIKGTEIHTLSEVLKKIKKEKIISIDQYLDNINDVDYSKMICEYLKNTLKECTEFYKLCEDGKNNLNKCKVMYGNNLYKKYEEKFLLLHKKIQSKIHNLIVFDALLSKVIYEVEGNNKYAVIFSDSPIEKFQKKYNMAFDLYSNVQKVIEKYSPQIENIIKDLEKIN
ncbi:6-hydroxymethylpterin diphosphokinase MptE-like protein [Clostridium sp. BJN0001]|uniref:motility associated factor glycosyltransferase family protein n=1 Tax=Clostridium sp. BJN0001 TaxID=2930219 RepID=UPI001FD34063|nr:6-hydroxymethylpterin diphosphokinase MptE-like protein [Clostridium sp. BJN0001]